MPIKCFIFLLFILPEILYCQNRNTISVGIGFPNIPRLTSRVLDFGEGKNYQSKGSGPYHLKYENRLKNWLSLGLNINYMDYEISYTGEAASDNGIVPNNIKIKCHNTAFNGRVNFHFLDFEEDSKVDFYAGVGIGVRYGKFKVSSEYPEYTPSISLPKSPLGFEITTGFRYFITDNIGLYAELGAAKSVFQLGVSGRF